jgi:hypothetical protein
MRRRVAQMEYSGPVFRGGRADMDGRAAQVAAVGTQVFDWLQD